MCFEGLFGTSIKIFLTYGILLNFRKYHKSAKDCLIKVFIITIFATLTLMFAKSIIFLIPVNIPGLFESNSLEKTTNFQIFSKEQLCKKICQWIRRKKLHLNYQNSLSRLLISNLYDLLPNFTELRRRKSGSLYFFYFFINCFIHY